MDEEELYYLQEEFAAMEPLIVPAAENLIKQSECSLLDIILGMFVCGYVKTNTNSFWDFISNPDQLEEEEEDENR